MERDNKLNIFDVPPDQVSWNVEVIFADSAFTKAVLYANRARVYEKEKETLLDGDLLVDFYSKRTNKKSSKLTADSARIDDNTKNMLARGNVVVISDSTGTKLETDVLEWIEREQKLYSTEYVKITTPNEIIEGYGFESDPKLENYTIHKVSGVTR